MPIDRFFSQPNPGEVRLPPFKVFRSPTESILSPLSGPAASLREPAEIHANSRPIANGFSGNP